MDDENEFVKIQVVDSKTQKVMEYIMTKEDSERSKTKQNFDKLHPSHSTPNFSYKNKDKAQWKYESTLLLINALQRRHKELNFPEKKKFIWKNIAHDLKKHGFKFDAQTCSKKWRNLIRTYRVCSKNLNKTGRLPYRFPYFKKMHKVLTFNPSLAPKDFQILNVEEDDFKNSLKEEPNYNTENEDQHYEDQIINEDNNEFFSDDINLLGKEHFWSYSDTITLIDVIQIHYDDYKTDKFWAIIASELQNHEVEVNAELCETKWNELLEAYNNSKSNEIQDNFLFFDEIDFLMNNRNLNEVKNDEDEVLLTINDQTEDDLNNENLGKKFEIDIKYKNSHINMVEPINIELMESENGYDCTEKFVLWKRKLDLEERKVKVLEDLLEFCRRN